MYNLIKFRRFLNTSRNIIGKHKHEQIVCVETEIYSPLINNDIYYRGYPVRQLALRNTFLENFYLLLNADLPSNNQNVEFINKIVCGMKDIPSIIRQQNGLIPSNTNICDFLTSSFSLMNLSSDSRSDNEYSVIFGQCLGILYQRYLNDSKNDLVSEDPVLNFTKQLLFNGVKKLGDSLDKLLNAIFTIYMEHGLTSASYNCRLCISEGGSTFSGLICATATHKYALQALDSYLLFNQLTDQQLKDILRSFESNNSLRFPLDEVTFPKRDPRSTILIDICKEHFGEDIFAKLTEIENRFSSKLYFKFDVYVFELMKRLHFELNNQAKSDFSEDCDKSILLNRELKDKSVTLLMVSRIAGWLSHISEQRRIGRRIEHLAAYIGSSPRLKYP